MRKYLSIIAIAAAAISTTNCEGNFDPKIYGSFIQSVYPSTAEDYNSLVVSCYGTFSSYWNTTMGGRTINCWFGPACGVMKVFDMPTDINAPWMTGGTSSWLYWGQADFTEATTYSRGYSDAYCSHFQTVSNVTRMTKIMQTIQNAPSNVLKDERKEELLGEMYLMRGFSMYLMLHKYGPLPYVTDPDKVKDTDALNDYRRPTLKEAAEQIASDLENAVLYAPAWEEVTEKGRYSKDFARFLLMHHYLNEGYYMDGYYAKAIAAYDELKASAAGYALFKTGSNPFQEQFAAANKFNCETIMSISVNPSSTGADFGNYNATCLYMYPNNAKLDDEASNPEFHYANTWSQYYNISPYFYGTFESGDLRAKCIITSYVTKTGAKVGPDNIGSTWDGYINNKFKPEVKKNYQPMDIPMARWADVLLMYAEADARLHNSVSPEAVAAVNEVRARAGLSGLSSAKTASVSAFLDAILDERGHELFYEGQRKIDLIRFNCFAQKNFIAKGIVPKSQYVPIPNYAVQQAAEAGVEIAQYWQRDEYAQDLALAK